MDYIGWSWFGITVICIVIEALTMGLTTIWFAIGAMTAFIVSVFGLNIQIQVMVFLVVAILCLIFTRPIAVKKLKIGKTKTNVDSLMGEKAKVTSTINNINNEGSVSIRGLIWSAKSLKEDEIIEKDKIVIIRDVKGVHLIVEIIK